MNNLHTHIGIIMDGNRRWAKAKGLPTLLGHKKGYEKMKQVMQWILDRGVPILTVYAFSTENWNRSKEEVAYLMRLIKLALTKDLNDLHAKGVRVRVIGKKDELAPALQKAIHAAEEKTKDNTKGTLNIAINYGGRQEIVEAVKQIIIFLCHPERVKRVEGSLQAALIEKLISQHLYTAGIPDPDLIIRTSGEQRLSNFLMWQSVYSELYFTPTLWPAFTEQDLDVALAWYTARTRNFGK